MGLDQTSQQRGVTLFLFVAFLGSFILKVLNVNVGAPFVTIDDATTFEGGFLVWFGNAPPQRMYLESWICGLTSLGTYAWKAFAGHTIHGIRSNLVADAYQDYYNNPDLYVQTYRFFVLFLDMVGAWMVYRIGLLTLGRLWHGWASALAAALYLFSFNTIWCDVVARPDAYVGVFSTIGLYFYYKSEFGEKTNHFWLAAIFFGISAGLKLHASFFVIFCVLDLFRVHGWRKTLSLALPWTIISVIFFALAAGIPLFDPLKYIKLRLVNAKDDESPWIQWGDQFYTIIKGSGWFVVPLMFFGMWQSLIRKVDGVNNKISSIMFLALFWILLFSSIRQLRAYWMLPALPLFYIAFLYAVSKLGNLRLRFVLVIVVLGMMVMQTARETHRFHQVEYGGLRNWVRENIQEKEPFFIYGFEAVGLPKSSLCIEKTKSGLVRGMAEDMISGETFVMRHLKNWEEESTLALFDMLSGRKDEGYSYYSVYQTPLDKYEGILDLDQMQYVFVMEGFDPKEFGVAAEYWEDNFNWVKELVGPGGGGRGLEYQVYIRKMEP